MIFGAKRLGDAKVLTIVSARRASVGPVTVSRAPAQ
jgi:hypothetical protein